MHKALRALTSAYSLFECVVVLALLALIFSFSAYFINNRGSAALVHQDLDRLHAVLVFMQRKALLEGKACCVSFDLKKNRYTADTVHTLSRGVIFGAPDQVHGPPSRPTALITNSVTWPQGIITFYPASLDGQIIVPGAISAGAIYLTDTKKSCLYALTCDASAFTHIRRYRYDNSWVLIQ